MEMVTKELPKATIVSVAHRVELEAFHSRKIVLERRKGGAKLVSDIDLIPRKGKRRLLGRFLRQRKAARRRRRRLLRWPRCARTTLSASLRAQRSDARHTCRAMDRFAALAMMRRARHTDTALICIVEVAPQNRLCMRRFYSEDICLTPDNDPSPAPFGAFAPNAAQAAIISLAQRIAAEARRVPADAVAAGEPAARGPGRRAVPGRVVPLLSSGQRHRARRAVQSRLQSSRSWIFCARIRPRAACSSMSAPMSAPMRWRWRAMSAPAAR